MASTGNGIPNPAVAEPAQGTRSVVDRFRTWLFWGLAIAAILYLAGSLYAGIGDVGGELARFQWVYAIPVLVLTVANYGLRFLKWHYLLVRLGIRVPMGENLIFFVSGLAMVISPGKAGEILKPWLVRARTGAAMARSIPALVTERLTDGIAMLILAAFGVATYAGEKVHYVVAPALAVALLLGVLAHRGLSMWILGLMGRLPGLGRMGHKLEEMYGAMRTCLSPGPFFLAIGVSVADGALGGGAYQMVPGITEAQAVASALLIRIATLWFGVGLGALTLVRIGTLLKAAPQPSAGQEDAAST